MTATLFDVLAEAWARHRDYIYRADPYHTCDAHRCLTELIAAIPAEQREALEDGLALKALREMTPYWTVESYQGRRSVRVQAAVDGPSEVLGVGPTLAAVMEEMNR